jgi:hypothetical protein
MTLLLWMACSDAVDSATETDLPPVDSPVDSEPQGCTEQAVLTGDSCVLEAACSWQGDPKSFFGQSFDVGDLDGDGSVDLVVGAPGTASYAGEVVLLSGDGWANRAALWSGEDTSDYVGSDLVVVPDADGDGLADVLVGAMGVDQGELTATGAVVLLNGAGDTLARWDGIEAYDRLGWTVSGGVDLNTDGLSDLWMTGDWRDADDDTGSGAAYLFFGGASGGSVTDADVTLSGVGRASLGQAYAHGDFDGDGAMDTVVSAPYAEGYKGAVYRVSGGALPETLPAPWLVGEASSDAFGYRLAAGDFDGDGVAELAVGAPLNDRHDSAAGAVFVYSGQELVAVWTGEWMDTQAGTGLGVADTDQDGDDELLIGSVSAWRGLATHSGRVYAVDPLVGGTLSDAPLKVHGGGTKDYLGHPVLGADLDGDGRDEVLLGGPYVNNDGAYDVGSLYLFTGQE